MSMNYDDLFIADQVTLRPACMCYSYRNTARAHRPGCEHYDPMFDPFVKPCWHIHKLDQLWTVCQVRLPSISGLHDTRYQGKTWEDAIVWLAVEYGRRRRERRELEASFRNDPLQMLNID
jgi:hypothetical protein